MSSFTESEERQTLRREVSRLASSYGREYFTRKARSGEKTTDLWLAIGKAGYLGINIPEQYGGGGGGIGDVAAVCEELAAQGCPLLMMVVSPAICGTVIAVPVADGAEVAAGQAVLVLEAMKMQHTISAPTDGVVTDLVAVGQQVAAGDVLAVVSGTDVEENES